MTDMKYASSGWSGIEVSKVCLGGMNFGKASPDFHQWAIDQQGTEQAINHEIGGTLKRLDTDYLEEPYTAHELVGSLSRPGEKDLSGTLAPTLKETTRN
ncbi:hypothetical protein ACE15W_06905 [Bifidobacterium catenulatum subsp. kashiwanohense]|uniref:hypothetical protein n=1 Tax=Bifidobacterium catenulatum TaxID=1686 RepID=UPI003CFCC0A6